MMTPKGWTGYTGGVYSIKLPIERTKRTMKKLIKLKNGNEKCPHCNTIFEHGLESLHPFDVAVRDEFRKRRSKAAIKGWKTRLRNARSREKSRLDWDERQA